jgi:hypothetical protein
LFYETNIDVTGDLIERFVNIVSDTPIPYQLDAPSTLIANMSQKNDNHYLMHLCNWTGEKFEKNDRLTYYLAPLENIHLEITVPDGKKLASLVAFPETQFEQKVDDKKVDIIIPKMKAYQGFDIRFTESGH